MAGFLRDGDNLLSLAAARPEQDHTRLMESVHHLAGSAAVFGAHDLQRELAEFERILKTCQADDHQEIRSKLEVMWSQLRKALKTQFLD